MIEANQALMHFNGYESKPEFLQSVTDISTEWYVEPDRRRTFRLELEKHGNITNFESEVFRHKTRERVWISENAHAVRDANGQILYYEGTVEDITSRKRVDIELRKRESMLEAVAFAAEQFLRAPDWRGNIRNVLDTLGSAIHASRGYCFEHFTGADGVEYSKLIYEWSSPDTPPLPMPSHYGIPHPVRREAGTINESLDRGKIYMGQSSTFPAADRERFDRLGIKALVEVPIMVDGRWSGTIGFNDMGRERVWSALEVDPLRIAANVLGAAIKRQHDETALQNELIQRKALIEELGVRNEESETLRESLASLTGSLEFSEIIEAIFDQIRRVVPYDSASIWRIENTRQTFIAGRDLPPIITEGYGFDIDPGNSAYPIMNGDVPYILCLDVQAQLADFRMSPHDYIQSWLAIPLKRRGSIVGLINLDGIRKNQFTEHHALLAVTFANQVSIALENSRLFSELQSELVERRHAEVSLRQRESILAVVAEAANRLLKEANWQVEIDNILEKLGTTISASHAYLFENYNLQDGSLVKSMLFEWTDARSESDLGNPRYINSPVGKYEFKKWIHDMTEGVPFVGDRKRLNPVELESLQQEGMMALLDVPIYVEGHWWGIIGFDDMFTAREWTNAEIDALVAAANVLGAAIQRQKADAQLQEDLNQRQRLISELEARNTEAETLRESAAVVALSLEFDEAVARILDQMKRIVPYDSASVQLLVDGKLEVIGGVGFPKGKDPAGMWFDFDESDPSYPILSGLPYVYYPNIQEVSDRFKEAFHEHIRSWMAVPLYARGRLIGMFALDGFTSDQFTEAHARFASTFANQAAVTLENARLYTEIQGELKKQVALGSAITAITSSLHLNEVLGEICKQLALTIDATSAYIANYDSSFSFYTVAAEYLSPNVNELERVSDLGVMYFKKDGAVIFDETYQITPATVHADDPALTAWARNNLLSYGGKSVLYIPLYIQGRLIGHTELWESRRKRDFTEEEISFCQVLSRQAAIAIENARLFADLQTELGTRKELIAELESKNTELERFTYTVSHDLKSPLFTIRGFLGYLKQDALSGDVDRLSRDIQRIVDATDKMQQLLNDLLELSRIGRLMNEPQDIRFGQLVHEVLELLHGQIHELGVQMVVEKDLPDVYGDRQRLFEVVQNLVDNAVKFMGDQPAPRIDIGLAGRQDWMPVFFVRDNGIGIPQEHFDRIFGLFNKLDPRSSGTGIGLALVKRIIEFHGGSIWVESEPGKGSTFFFTLPSRPKSDSVI